MENSEGGSKYLHFSMCLFLLFTWALSVEAPLNISKDGTICYGLLDTSYSGPLVIPEGVKIIWKEAFSVNTKLTSLKLPQSLVEIQERAFRNCTGFTGSFVIPDNVNEIGVTAFYNCSGFTGTLTLGKSVTRIGNFAFQSCTGLTGSLIIPDSVTEIGNQAFAFCNGLTEVHVGRQITQIPSYAFWRCSLLKRCFFYNSKVTIRSDTFSQCPELHVFYEVNKCKDFTIDTKPFDESSLSNRIACLASPQLPQTPLFSTVLITHNSLLKTLQLAFVLLSL